jgi:hypothetical protein
VKVGIRFRDITLGRVDAKLFEVPAGYRRYNNLEELVNAARARRPAVPARPTRRK